MGGGGAPALPQRHSQTPTLAPTTFPTASNRPPTIFTVPCHRSVAGLELPQAAPSPPPPFPFKQIPGLHSLGMPSEAACLVRALRTGKQSLLVV